MTKSPEYKKACEDLQQLHFDFCMARKKAKKETWISFVAQKTADQYFLEYKNTLARWNTLTKLLKERFPNEYNQPDIYSNEPEDFSE